MKSIQLAQSNYLENEIISSYLHVFEYETYFTSIRYKDFSRKEYDKVIDIFTKFLNKTNNEHAISQLNEAVFSQRIEGKIYPTEKIELFNLDDVDSFLKELSFESIKKQYRKAAMRLHPDKGGSNEDMKNLNRLLIELNDYVKEKTINESFDDESFDNKFPEYFSFGTKSFEDYYCLLNIILLNIYLDEWNALKAYSKFKEIDDFYCIKRSEELFDVFYGETDYATKLARILTIANMNTEAIDVLNRTNSALNSKKHSLAIKDLYLRIDYTEDEIKSAIKKLKRKCQFDLIDVISSIYGIKKIRCVMNHFRKAENCYALGIINETQYKKSIARLIKNHQDLMDKESVVNDYLNTKSFAKLPSCTSTPVPTKSCTNVEWPKSYTGEGIIRFNQLSNEQKNEYLKTFSKESNYDLLFKYREIRVSDMLESIILFNESIDNLNNIIDECSLYIKLGFGYQGVMSICQTMLATKPKEKFKKLQIIKYIIVIFGEDCKRLKDGIRLRFNESHNLEISPVDDYLIHKTNNNLSIIDANDTNLFYWNPDTIAKLFSLEIEYLEAISRAFEDRMTGKNATNNRDFRIYEVGIDVYFNPFSLTKYALDDSAEERLLKSLGLSI